MPDLSLSNAKVLLELARESIKTFLEKGDHPAFRPPDPEFSIPRGCFVTLYKEKQLRGCIGTFSTDKPLYENVMRMAVAAATQDPRFEPVKKNELPQIRIEISVLGELQKVSSLEEIQIGRDGIYVKLGKRSGTYLPDVAVHQKWQVPEFVTFCAREKAGLSPEECSRAEVYRYEVQKFEE